MIDSGPDGAVNQARGAHQKRSGITPWTISPISTSVSDRNSTKNPVDGAAPVGAGDGA